MGRQSEGGAVFLAFALFDAEQHTLGIDVAHLQRHCLRNAQAGTVAIRFR